MLIVMLLSVKSVSLKKLIAYMYHHEETGTRFYVSSKQSGKNLKILTKAYVTDVCLLLMMFNYFVGKYYALIWELFSQLSSFIAYFFINYCVQ